MADLRNDAGMRSPEHLKKDLKKNKKKLKFVVDN